MVVEHAYLRIIKGSESQFELSFEEARPILLGAQGCVSAELLRDAEHPSAYLLRVGWERLQDHLETFPRSEDGQRFAHRVAGFFAEDPEVRHFIAPGIAERG